MPYQRELQAALDAALTGARVLARHYADGSRAWDKSEDNPVTEADLEADAAIADLLKACFPHDLILSEETASDASRVTAARVWIVDPMDGTKEFVGRIPEFCSSVALVDEGEPVAAAIANPAAGVAVWAALGTGTCRADVASDDDAVAAIAAGRQVRVTACERLQDAVVIASRTEISRGRLDAYRDWFADLRPVGSIAWKLACIASGEADLNVSVAPKNEWDVCAGDLLVREAGGVYVDFEGSRRVYNRADTLIEAGMAAGGPAIVSAFRERVSARGA